MRCTLLFAEGLFYSLPKQRSQSCVLPRQNVHTSGAWLAAVLVQRSSRRKISSAYERFVCRCPREKNALREWLTTFCSLHLTQPLALWPRRIRTPPSLPGAGSFNAVD